MSWNLFTTDYPAYTLIRAAGDVQMTQGDQIQIIVTRLDTTVDVLLDETVPRDTLWVLTGTLTGRQTSV